MSYRARVVSAVAGFRGAVSLAIALSVPATLHDGSPFPARDDIVLVTAGVILLTLLVQGPLLPAVVRWANLPADHTAKQELRLAEQEITTSAIAALPALAAERGISDQVLNRLTADYREHLALAQMRQRQQVGQRQEQFPAQPDHPREAVPEGKQTRAHGRPGTLARHRDEYTPLARNEEYTGLRIAMLEHKREVLLRLRRNGSIDDTVARQLETRLDIEELRLTGVDPLE